jgi:regulatory protein
MRKALRVLGTSRGLPDPGSVNGVSPESEQRPGRRQAERVPARQQALTLLARKDWTRKAMLDRLVADGCDAADATDAVNYLMETGYLDDRAYAARFVEAARARAGRGPARLERELLARGVSPEVAAEALGSERDPAGEAEQAIRVAREFLRATPAMPPRKLASRLASRGFSWDAVRTALTRTGTAPEDDPEP